MRSVLLTALAATVAFGSLSFTATDAAAKNKKHRHYDAAEYYRVDNRRYQERVLSPNERIYRGSDGRYYCKHSDGTTGLIIGALAGGAFGNAIAPRDSRTLGTVLGGVGGALIGREIERGSVRCR